MFLCHLVRWPSADIHRKFYGDHPKETPPSGELNPRGVAKYSNFEPIKGYISETVQDRAHCVKVVDDIPNFLRQM